jgi:DNA repair exonuclease SbcCD nuclease subunit
MRPYLIIGDVHATPSELNDCWELMHYINQIAIEHKVHGIVFLGDQYHTHSIIHLEVQDFWRKALEYLKEPTCNTICLVGNHDMSGVKESKVSAMDVHDQLAFIINKPTCLDGILYIPYMADTQEFIRVCQKYHTDYPEVKIVVCHQEFNGANMGGMYSKEGIDINQIPQAIIVSGHIHAKQQLDKVFYPGSPRWRTLADANEHKSIVLMDFYSGTVIKEFPTDKVCKKVIVHESHESQPLEHTLDPHTDTTIKIFGSAKFCESEAERWKALGAKVKVFVDQVTVATIKESDGLSTSFYKYWQKYQPPRQSLKEQLWKLAQNRISWLG